MRLARVAGLLTRIALLFPLIAGSRLDCGLSGADRATAGAVAHEADCHGASESSRDATHHHGTPAQQDHRAPGGHCPSYHSCALDFSFTARWLDAGDLAPRGLASASDRDRLASLDQLPELPPPKA